MDTTKQFFVFGLQKSGTKYAKRLVEINTNLSFCKDYVWKHTMDTTSWKDDDIVKFWITKSPYNWVRSVLYRHRVDILNKYRRYNFSNNDTLSIRDLNIKSLVLLYNDYHSRWVDNKVSNIQYEELLKDCFNFFKQLHLNNVCDVTLPPQKSIDTSKFYIKQEVKEEYLSVPRSNDPLIVEINKYIDKDVINQLGYKVA